MTEKVTQTLTACTCQKCSYSWFPRTAGTAPKECPNCKSRKWQEERKEP